METKGGEDAQTEPELYEIIVAESANLIRDTQSVIKLVNEEGISPEETNENILEEIVVHCNHVVDEVRKWR
jgi:hypothetical protein